MKKLLLISIIFLFVFKTGRAQTNVYQPFPKDSAVWLYINTINAGSQSWFYTKWLGDTVINSTTYTKRFANSGNANGQFGSAISWVYTGGVRQDIPNEKVYYIDLNGVEYDGSVNQHLTVGDVLFSSMIIKSVDSALIGNKYHKSYNLQDSISSDLQTYVVGVGIFGTSFPQGHGDLTCFTVDNVSQFGSTPPFCQLASIGRIEKSHLLVIYPNPAQNNFTIETSSAEKQIVLVYDVNGKQVLAQTINGTTNVDGSNLAAGVYNLSLLSNTALTNKKLLIVK
ncbi:MAG TPA: T9SS type A sorting domain-containing protein [Bacteroidia bacterium]|jgi:hypothetical protein|nr:T9SS type A sorting domain-containing protein [Bacteroidia bacterium]